MERNSDLQLHFDFLSCRALLSCEGRGYVLPEVYPTKEAAHVAAQKFAWEKLGLKRRTGRIRQHGDLEIWMR